MQTRRNVSLWKVFVPLLALLSCHSEQQITASDASAVLARATNAAVKVLPSNYCVEPRLEQSPVTTLTHSDDGGWVRPSGQPNLKVRLIHYSAPERLPPQALSAFSNQTPQQECRNPIVFAKPSFIETKSAQGSKIEAVVSFSNNCPLCGAGYEIHFVKNGNEWETLPPGILTAWVS